MLRADTACAVFRAEIAQVCSLIFQRVHGLVTSGLAAQIAKAYEEGGAACLSVLTDRKYFQGSFEYLQDIRNAGVTCPLLCKEFIVEVWASSWRQIITLATLQSFNTCKQSSDTLAVVSHIAIILHTAVIQLFAVIQHFLLQSPEGHFCKSSQVVEGCLH